MKIPMTGHGELPGECKCVPGSRMKNEVQLTLVSDVQERG